MFSFTPPTPKKRKDGKENKGNLSVLLFDKNVEVYNVKCLVLQLTIILFSGISNFSRDLK